MCMCFRKYEPPSPRQEEPRHTTQVAVPSEDVRLHVVTRDNAPAAVEVFSPVSAGDSPADADADTQHMSQDLPSPNTPELPTTGKSCTSVPAREPQLWEPEQTAPDTPPAAATQPATSPPVGSAGEHRDVLVSPPVSHNPEALVTKAPSAEPVPDSSRTIMKALRQPSGQQDSGSLPLAPQEDTLTQSRLTAARLATYINHSVDLKPSQPLQSVREHTELVYTDSAAPSSVMAPSQTDRPLSARPQATRAGSTSVEPMVLSMVHSPVHSASTASARTPTARDQSGRNRGPVPVDGAPTSELSFPAPGTPLGTPLGIPWTTHLQLGGTLHDLLSDRVHVRTPVQSDGGRPDPVHVPSLNLGALRTLRVRRAAAERRPSRDGSASVVGTAASSSTAFSAGPPEGLTFASSAAAWQRAPPGPAQAADPPALNVHGLASAYEPVGDTSSMTAFLQADSGPLQKPLRPIVHDIAPTQQEPIQPHPLPILPGSVLKSQDLPQPSKSHGSLAFNPDSAPAAPPNLPKPLAPDIHVDPNHAATAVAVHSATHVPGSGPAWTLSETGVSAAGKRPVGSLPLNSGSKGSVSSRSAFSRALNTERTDAWSLAEGMDGASAGLSGNFTGYVLGARAVPPDVDEDAMLSDSGHSDGQGGVMDVEAGAGATAEPEAQATLGVRASAKFANEGLRDRYQLPGPSLRQKYGVPADPPTPVVAAARVSDWVGGLADGTGSEPGAQRMVVQNQ